MKKVTTAFLSLFLVVVVSMSIVSCGTNTSASNSTRPLSTVASTTSTPLPATTATRVITDMYGRQVTVPTVINRVVTTDPIEMELVYLLAPDKLVGLNFAFNGNPPLVPAKYASLPVVGGWFGTQTGNYETLIATKPDIVLEDDQSSIAERQQKFGSIPVVGIKITDYVTGYEDAIRFLGNLLGVQSQAQSLITYYEDAMNYVNGIVSQIPESQRVTVYYAEGKDGLSTDPAGSMHTRLLQFCGGINVAQVPLLQGYGMASASMEQIMLWNPDMIIIGRGSQADLFHTIMTDPTWGQLTAVKNKNMFVRPQNPFSWFDGPPGVCQIVGMYWMVHILYPKQTENIDLNAKVKEFYSKFMHYNLTDHQVEELIANKI